jgi:hypothetical protein
MKDERKVHRVKFKLNNLDNLSKTKLTKTTFSLSSIFSIMILKLQIRLEFKFSKLNSQPVSNLLIQLIMPIKIEDLDFQALKNLKEIPLKIIHICIRTKNYRIWLYYKMKVLIKVLMK